MAIVDAKAIAVKIAQTCKKLGWSYEVRNSILVIEKPIQGMDEFCVADSEYFEILSLLPTTSPGSMWGTDGGGVGAMYAMNTGMFCMKKSGGSKRVLNALKKVS